MQSCKRFELKGEEVSITWGACALCSAVGPRFMKLIRNRHEYTVELDTQCCGLTIRNGTLRNEESLFAMESMRGQRYER